MFLVSVFIVLIVVNNFRYYSFTVLQDSESIVQAIGFFAISVVAALVIFLILLVHTIATNNGHKKIGQAVVRVFWCFALPYSAVFGEVSILTTDPWGAFLLATLSALWLVFGGNISQTMKQFFRESARDNRSELAVDSVKSAEEVIPYHIMVVVFLLGMQVIPLFYR